MKLALHRSLTFWSGILVMAFIVWAWRDSWRHVASCSGNQRVCVHAAGVVLLSRNSDPATARRFATVYDPLGAYDPVRYETFPPVCLLRGGDGAGVADGVELPTIRETVASSIKHRPAHDWTLLVPHWIILMVLAAVWLALLIWRARRRKGLSPGDPLPDRCDKQD